MRRDRPSHLLLLSVLMLIIGVPMCLPAKPNQPADLDEHEVADRLSSLQQEIARLQQRLETSRTEHRNEQAQLRDLDLAIQTTARRLRDLDAKHSAHLKELASLEERRSEQLRDLSQRQDQLAHQVAATYRLASQSRLKLVLNQDSPARISRMLAYYDHFNRAQVTIIRSLRAMLLELEQTQRLIEAELQRIKTTQNEQHDVQERQQAQRAERKELVTALATQIDNAEAQLRNLERDRKDLEELLQRLSDVLADIPADLGQHLSITEQRGNLAPPVKGRVLHPFGQRRTAGMNWQGWLMEAPNGTEVINIAYGRVAFADWLRGYGLLMIIDHGQGFMSLYGYNESLLWDVGDWVEPGAVIATVGGSQGGDQGLYFEMRKDGKAVDPAVWLKR